MTSARDRRVPPYVKALPVLAILYAALPKDLVPDILPVAGQLDDLVVVGCLLGIFVLRGLKAIVKSSFIEARNRHSQKRTIEGRYRHMESTE